MPTDSHVIVGYEVLLFFKSVLKDLKPQWYSKNFSESFKESAA